MDKTTDFLGNVCVACDALESKFTQEKVADLMKVDRTKLAGILARLVRFNVLSEMPEEGKRPRYYKTLENLEEAHKNGKLTGLFGPKGDSQSPRKFRDRVETPQEPEEETIEVDPIDILSNMDPDDFGQLLSVYVARKMAEVDPLRQEITSLKDQVRYITSQRGQTETELSGKILELRTELAGMRERHLELQTELSREKGLRIQPEAPIKTVLVTKGSNNPQRQQGISGGIGASKTTVVIHKKPNTSHPSSTVVQYAQRRVVR